MTRTRSCSWLLLAAAVAPLILAWIILRDHELSWPRGELTAVVAMIALVLILYVGVIDRPGEPSGEIALRIGWYLALLGSLLEIVGGAIRAAAPNDHESPQESYDRTPTSPPTATSRSSSCA